MLPYVLALLACAPRYSALDALAPAELSTPLPLQHVTVQGIDVAYVDSGGDKPPLVLVHGLSSSIGFWEYQIPHFAETHRVLALDLPGYGASARPDAPCTPPWYAALVADWMVAVGVEHAPIMGHSMGGQIALTLALDHRERVDALLLSAPAGLEHFQPGHAAWMKTYWHEERALEASETELRVAFTQAVFNKVDAGVERLLEERVRMGKHPAFRGTSVAVSRSIAGMVDHPVRHRLGEIRVPTQIVYGTDDRMIPNPVFNGGRTRTVAVYGRDHIPGAALELIPGAGHTVHHDAPDVFNRVMSDFLARLPAPSPSGPKKMTVEELEAIQFGAPASPAPVPAPTTDDDGPWGDR